MKINVESNGAIQIRTTVKALATLELTPFANGTSTTARGNLVNPTGNGWAWISRFDGQVLPLLEDLEKLELAEKLLALKVKFA